MMGSFGGEGGRLLIVCFEEENDFRRIRRNMKMGRR